MNEKGRRRQTKEKGSKKIKERRIKEEGSRGDQEERARNGCYKEIKRRIGKWYSLELIPKSSCAK
jgi:hypothetical protein